MVDVESSTKLEDPDTDLKRNLEKFLLTLEREDGEWSINFVGCGNEQFEQRQFNQL